MRKSTRKDLEYQIRCHVAGLSAASTLLGFGPVLNEDRNGIAHTVDGSASILRFKGARAVVTVTVLPDEDDGE